MICTMQVTNYNYYNNYNVYSARVHVKYYAGTYYTVSDIIGRVGSNCAIMCQLSSTRDWSTIAVA